MALPQFLPLPAAAKRLGLTETELRARVKAGTIAAGVLPDGEIIVNTDVNDLPTDDINARLRAIRREDFAHLRGKAITISGAEKRYGVSGWTLRNWIDRKYISVDETLFPMELDESDVAFCVAIHTIRQASGIRTGAPLIDDNGKPYLLKHPALSRYRRESRQMING